MYSEEFLNRLFTNKSIKKMARITRLNLDNQPLEEITGQITSGSLNLDNKSNVQRTCSLSMVVLNSFEADIQWALTSRFKLEIGMKNEIDSNYPQEIWFNQGIFIITSFNSSTSGSTTNINISGKDKMCMLNGEYGGKFHAQIDFGKEEIVTRDDSGKAIITTNKIPIKTIITKMLQQYGNEPLYNIIIEDLDDFGLQLLEYRGDGNLYLIRRWDQDFYSNIYINELAKNTKCYVKVGNDIVEKNLTDLPHYDTFLSNNLIDQTSDKYKISFEASGNWENLDDRYFYAVAKLSYGETSGYYQVKLVYPGELIANVGETITSVLDKIKNMLGDFEYFYNANGQFVFRRQHSYTGVAWSPLVSDDQELHINEGLAQNSAIEYRIDDDKLVTQISVSPNSSNLSNDFSIWGERQGISGAKIPIHIRYAIDEKPVYYKSLEFTDADLEIYNEFQDIKVKSENYVQPSQVYCSGSYQGSIGGAKIVDWRELIYQMAKDWYKGNYLDDFTYRLSKANPWVINGKTKYEQYYPDLMSFWRQIYNPDKIVTSFEKVLIKNGKISFDSYNFLADKNGIFLQDINGLNLMILDWKEDPQTNEKYYTIENRNFTALLDQNSTIVQKNLIKDSNNQYYLRNNMDVYYFNNYIIGFNNYICLPPSDNCPIKLYDEKKNRITEAQKIGTYWYYKVGKVDKDTFNTNEFFIENNGNFIQTSNYNEDTVYYKKIIDIYYYNVKNTDSGFLDEVNESPESLNFWFDFLDPNNTLLQKSSVKVIGDKLFPQKDQDVGSIYYKQTPNLIYVLEGDNKTLNIKTGYTYINLPIYCKNLFSISSKKKSALEAVENLIYTKNYAQQSVNVTIIPNYNLKPGSRIYLKNQTNNIEGEFLIDRISVGLDYSALMQLTLTKAPDRLL